MSLSLDDFEDVKQEEKQSAAATAAAEAASSPASAPAVGVAPPTSGSTGSGLNVPGLINQAWETVKPAFNPVHYGAGGPQDYTNIDVPTTVAHGLGLAGAGLGLSNRIKREISGEAAAARQYKRQNDIAEERMRYQQSKDALIESQQTKQVEQKVAAQAAGQSQARIEPTFAPEPTPAPAAVPQSVPAPVATKPAAIPPLPQPTVQPPVDYSLNPTAGYGQQNLNAPTGAPSPLLPAAPPAEVAPAPVEPKPMSEIERVRLEKAQFELEAAKAKEARAAELHANRLAADAKRAEAKTQQKTASGSISPQDQQMLASSEKAKIEKAIEASGVKKTPKPAPVASVAPPATPNLNPPSQAPATVAEAQAAGPTIGTAQEVAKASTPASTEVKGAKAPKWPGGAEGSAVQLFGGTKKNFTPESQAAVEMFKDFVGSNLTMPPTGGAIHQIPEASKFYEKYTGEPLPRSSEGKLMRIPEAQMQKLHAGINSELQDAVKGGKLSTMGKGAMAAAALLGLTGAVQAAQKGDFGPLRQAGFDIGGPIALGKLGLTALSRAGGAGFSAATYSGNLNEGEQEELARRRHDYMMKESQKLGSPYRSVPPPK
jgi:hypothetical protein